MPNLLEIAQGRQIPLTAGILEIAKKEAPAVVAFDARTSSDTRFQTLALVELPEASGFKNYGEGAKHGSARLELREFSAKLMVAKVEAERITAARWDAANASTGTTYFDLQLSARMASEMRALERQMFYGSALDAKGFPGLKELTPSVSGNVLGINDDPGSDDYVRSVIDAGGTTATTASSVYSVVFGPLEAQLVACNDFGSELFEMFEPIRQHLAPDATKPDETLEYLIGQLQGHFGLAVSGMNETPGNVVPTQRSVRRLANVTRDSTKSLDDKKLERLVTSHNDSITPDRLFMSNRSYMDWRDSRSATNVTVFLGGGGDAVNVRGTLHREREAFEGIPITVTNAIRNNDAIETV